MSPDEALTRGADAKFHLIIDDQEDEGTLFALAQRNISTTAAIISYLQSFFSVAGASLIPSLVATYPSNNRTSGSPFRTSSANNLYPQFKRLAAILGDVTSTLARRSYLTATAASLPGPWSYLDSHLHGVPDIGTIQASDVLEIFDNEPVGLTAAAFPDVLYVFCQLFGSECFGQGQ